MKLFSSLLFAIFLLPLGAFAFQIRITAVHDGDTLNAVGVTDGVKYKVRLMGVDTPEVDFFGNTQGEIAYQARDFLRTLLPVDSIVEVSNGSQADKHGRILGRLVKDGVDINKEMLRQGWGVMYFIYPFDKRYVSDYSKAAKEAYDAKRGLFAYENSDVEIPYLFRLTSRNQVGRNPVGDAQTKKLYAPDNYEKVPVYRRVFFSNSDDAKMMGYAN